MSIPCDLAKVSPKDARLGFRNHTLQGVSCGQLSRGYLQANIVCIPSDMADDFEEYCRLNSAPCPLLYRSEPGEVSAPALADDVDVRTDLPFYSLGKYDDIKLVEDLLDVPWEEMVTFYIGCSFSFESALLTANIPIHHLTLGQDVAVYCVNIPCHPVGPFSGHMLVSVRSVPKDLVQRAVEITVPLDFCHGAPIHIGDPGIIGIKDAFKKEYGGPPVMPHNEVPLFWGCGMTGLEAIASAKPLVSVCLGHGCAGSLLITDHLTEDYMRRHQTHPPQKDPPKPRVVFLSEAPLFASIVSEQALKKIQSLQSSGEVTTIPLPDQVNEMSNTALKLSHALDVAILIGSAHNLVHKMCSALSLTKALLALGKKVVLIAEDDDSVSMFGDLIGRAVEQGVLSRHAEVIRVSDKTASDYLPARLRDVVPCLQSALDLVVRSQGGTLSVVTNKDIQLNGNTLAAALYILHTCPLHSRYLRQGVGEHKVLSVDKVLVTPTEVERCLPSDKNPQQTDNGIKEAWSLMQRNYDAMFQ